MINQEIARIFNSIADILEIKEDNPFRIRAYRRAAQAVDSLPEDVTEFIKKDALLTISGIGKDLAEKIKEYVSKKKIRIYEDLKKEIPKGIMDFMNIPGVGPKTAEALYKDLKIKNLKDLQIKAKAGKIKSVPGIKEKTIENILKGVEFLKKSEGKIPLYIAQKIADEIITALKKIKSVLKIEAAGSLRRRKETVRDIDIVAASEKPKSIMDAFIGLAGVKEVLAHGLTKSSIRRKEGIQVDLRVVDPGSYGSALAYLTGSKAHNIKLRKMGVKAGLKINEYGVFSVKNKEKKLGGRDEKDVYEALGLSYVPPEMREDTGEIELAAKRKLPRLITMDDIKSDLHMHSEASDGALSLEDIARVAKTKGYEYAVITEHSKTLHVAGGLSEKELFRQIDKINRLNHKLSGIKLLKGAEVEILGDGTMDYKDDVLKELDFVIAAIHSGFKQTKETLTMRILKAADNRFVHMIAHLTGRLMGVRDAYEVDIKKILKAARDTNTALEINAYPDRLDLNDVNSRAAKDAGVSLGIGTDAHTREQFDSMAYGVDVARRGWLEKKDVLNTLNLKDFLKRIKK